MTINDPQLKLALFDELIEQNENLREAYDECLLEIVAMSRAIWTAKNALDQANAALLAFIENPTEFSISPELIKEKMETSKKAKRKPCRRH